MGLSRYALRIVFFSIAFAAVLLGVAVLLARGFGKPAAFVWIAAVIILYMIFAKKIQSFLRPKNPKTAEDLADIFIEVVDEKKSKNISWFWGAAGYLGFLVSMLIFIALWGKAGGAAWFILFFLILLILFFFNKKKKSD
ncbi:hypothetical protein ACFLU6_04005 [Acidobacteriota bacterium]